MLPLGEVLSLATPRGAIMGESLTFMGLYIAKMHLRQLCSLRC